MIRFVYRQVIRFGISCVTSGSVVLSLRQMALPRGESPVYLRDIKYVRLFEELFFLGDQLCMFRCIGDHGLPNEGCRWAFEVKQRENTNFLFFFT